eukprot:CAMPEP_0198461152 /NCGR_PEP_ID=MMETSP1453-20131121/42307_1 /TAXON_ID=1461543 ORGANISM="Unidentified sp., Strain RCC701" /NCGR_SAMPLE_ID=MMETSP1453 /ASSEMBLY_ACC=CAM_ASM_001118 /LENGTH=257 /DNA_ID=CAMNT_0044186159 /DNA_START=84 /DNA_END=857 /DNA_ORIENTATION=-
MLSSRHQTLDQENSTVGLVAGKENSSHAMQASSQKTPLAARGKHGAGALKQRQALGNITNKTPKTGGKPARRPFGEMKTPNTATRLAGAARAPPSQQKQQQKSSHKKPQQAAPQQRSAPSLAGPLLLAREVDRRADLFAEQGVEYWCGDTLEAQEAKRATAEAAQVRESVRSVKAFMLGGGGSGGGGAFASSAGERGLAKEECGDVAPMVSFETVSDEDLGDIESLLADTIEDESSLFLPQASSALGSFGGGTGAMM